MIYYLRDITLPRCTNQMMCADETKHNDVTLLVVEIGIILFFYFLQLLILGYNISKFIIGQGRYKVFHLSFFYSLSSIIIICRITFFVIILDFLSRQTTDNIPQRIDILDNFTIFFELSLGIQQLFSIIELHLMLQFSQLFKTNNALDAQTR